MPEYKDVTELKKQISDFKRMVQSPNSDYLTGYVCALSVTEGMIAGLRKADVVSSAVLEQVMWERDMALETLKEHGIGFCEKSDMVKVRHGEWKMRGGVPRCSECDEKALQKDEGGTGGFSHEYVRVKSSYCPNCGAKMDGKKG